MTSHSNGIFITGTGTGVGKTVVTASLAVALARLGISSRIIKPFATGIYGDSDWQDNDPQFLRVATKSSMVECVTGHTWKLPLSPYDAARLENKSCDPAAIMNDLLTKRDSDRFEIWEGAGGVLVPVTESYSIRDAIAQAGLPVLVVASAILGGINHTLLTLEALKGFNVAGVVFNNPQGTGGGQAGTVTPETVARLTGVTVFGTLPYRSVYAQAHTAEEAAGLLPWDSPPITALANFVTQTK